jgi:hypothetical protein
MKRIDSNKRMRKIVENIVKSKLVQLQENEEMSSEQPTMDKSAFIEAVKKYNRYKESFSKSSNLKKIVSEIGKLVRSAEPITLQETGEWFDNITVNRHMKQMNEAYKVLEKTASELMQSQQRFESAYNDIGRVLENYYDICEGDCK